MNRYDNIIFKIELRGFSLSAEDENKQVNFSVDFSDEGLYNSVRKLFGMPPKITIAAEELIIKDKKTKTLTEVINFETGEPPFKYVDGKVIFGGGGEDLLIDEKERLNFYSHKIQYEQTLAEKNDKKKKHQK